MDAGRMPFKLLAMTSILAMVSGCASTTVRTVDAELARVGTGLREDAGQSIGGYRLQDASEHEYKGHVRFVGADSLMFWTDQSIQTADDFGAGEMTRAAGPVLPATTVAALRVVESDYTIVTVGFAIVVALVAWVLINPEETLGEFADMD